MTDKAPPPNRYAIFLREKAKAFNLAYIKQDLEYAADEIDRLERDLAAARAALRAGFLKIGFDKLPDYYRTHKAAIDAARKEGA